MKAIRHCLIILMIMFFSTSVWADILILGESKIIIPRGARIGVQVDRVIRDIAWKGSIFDERRSYMHRPSDINDVVPYMEGRMAQLLLKYADVKLVPLTPCLAIKKEDGYYASDASTGYPFIVEESKTKYSTARFDKDRTGQPYAFFYDTHGFNMVAEAAIMNNWYERLDLVIACMDTPAKAQAARYLAEHGINCFAPCDRFLSDLHGISTSYTVVIGTAPLRQCLEGAVIGDQPVSINTDEPIIVQNTNKAYPDQYCDTPTRYFESLQNKLGIALNVIKVDAGVGETANVIAIADKLQVRVIGVRIYNEADAKPVEEWLCQDANHRAILFHSAAYEPGFQMFFKFPKQTSFGDLNPKMVKKQ